MDTAIRTILRDDAAYPLPLRNVIGAPERLFLKGTLPPPETPAIAIVGTRKATTEGKRLAQEFARTFAARGLAVVSGLAFGIDAASHEGALEAGGITLAVLANGLDTVYPAAHENLAGRILGARGALLSEYPAGTPALPHQFLERNRIVSGLSRGIVIIEAPARSGALATARHALEQGREVFVLPGSVKQPNYAGSHMLLREGARLVTSPEDVLLDLGLAEPEDAATMDLSLLSKNEQALVECLRAAGKALTLDALALASRLPIPLVSQTITFLTLRGLVVEESDGTFMMNRIP